MFFLRGTVYIHGDILLLLCGTICGVTDYSQAWTTDMESASRDYNDLDANVQGTEGEHSDSDSDTVSESDSGSASDGDSDDVANAITESAPNGQLTSEAYTEFLQFLELGCSGSPIEGYPLVLVVLASIPKSVCSPCALSAPFKQGTCRFCLPTFHPLRQRMTKKGVERHSTSIPFRNSLHPSGLRSMQASSIDEQQPPRGSRHSANA